MTKRRKGHRVKSVSPHNRRLKVERQQRSLESEESGDPRPTRRARGKQPTQPKITRFGVDWEDDADGEADVEEGGER